MKKRSPSNRPDSAPDMLLNTVDAAAALLVKPQTLHKWACYENGPIRPVRIGRMLGWKQSDIERLTSIPAYKAPLPIPESAPEPTPEERRAAALEAWMGGSGQEGEGGDMGFVDLAEPAPRHWTPQPAPHALYRGPYKRGDLLAEKQFDLAPYRVERVLVDLDTGARFYQLQRIDTNRNLWRSYEIVENPDCFHRVNPMLEGRGHGK